MGRISNSAKQAELLAVLDNSLPHRGFYRQLRKSLPAERIVVNSLAREVMSRDASLYRLLPRLVVLVRDEREVQVLLRCARDHAIGLTFRAAGTSLSGQATTDSVLVQLDTPFWRKVRIEDDGARIALGPSVTGGAANAALVSFGRKIGPDPASVASAQIGGIVANNASGMCCGTEQNSYHTVESLRLVLFDGTILDTGSQASREEFRKSHASMLDNINAVAKDLSTDNALRSRVIEKHKMKNTMGYGLNAFVDYDDPIDMLERVVIGSEGSLAFVSEVRYRTVSDARHKAACILFFPDFAEACKAVLSLRACEGIKALEIADREAFRAIEHVAHFPTEARSFDDKAAFLLLDVHAEDQGSCERHCAAVSRLMEAFPTLYRTAFAQERDRYSAYWAMRKEMYPSMGKRRAPGTFFMQEDVVFPVERLAEGAAALRAVFDKHGYRKEGIIFGHARDGNLHACLALDLSSSDGLARYEAMMEDLVETVVDRFDGALKGEHGTGRNMAPFVEREWGSKAYALMKRIKTAIDPAGILNPGVVLNDDPSVHIAHLKTFPQVYSSADACTECGFCERVCPTTSYAMSMTPRQRVVALRRRAEKKFSKSEEAWFRKAALESCVGDSLCHTVCPVGIDTGELMRQERARRHSSLSQWLAKRAARNMGRVTAATRLCLRCVFFVRKRLGTKAARVLHKTAQVFAGELAEELFLLPLRPARTSANFSVKSNESSDDASFVFFPSCASRMFGGAWGLEAHSSTEQALENLCRKARLRADRLSCSNALCCGLAFHSKGFFAAADVALENLHAALPSEVLAGKKPLLCDAAPCAERLRQATLFRDVKVWDAITGAKNLLLPRLRVPSKPPVDAAVAETSVVIAHLPCAARRAGLEQDFLSTLKAFSPSSSIVSSETLCCGFGGDLGLRDANLNKHALRALRARLQQKGADSTALVSASRTCEIGLAWHGHAERQVGGVACHSLWAWLDRATSGDAFKSLAT